MKVPCAVALLAFVAFAAAGSPSSSSSSSSSPSSPSSEGLKSTVAIPSPSGVHQSSYPGPTAAVPYPVQGYQFAPEYSNPFAKSAAFAAKSTAVPSSFAAYQPYHQQQQQYNFGPYQQYNPASGYPSAASVAGPYPTAYSSQSTGAAYPTPYSAYPAYQPYHGGSYSSSYPSPSYFASYNSQFAGGPSASPYNGQFASGATPTATPYSAMHSGYQHQQLPSSFYSSAAGQQYSPSQQFQSQQYPSQQYPSQQYPSQQYPSFYQNSPAAASDSAKPVSAEKK